MTIINFCTNENIRYSFRNYNLMLEKRMFATKPERHNSSLKNVGLKSNLPSGLPASKPSTNANWISCECNMLWSTLTRELLSWLAN